LGVIGCYVFDTFSLTGFSITIIALAFAGLLGKVSVGRAVLTFNCAVNIIYYFGCIGAGLNTSLLVNEKIAL
jgi:hypothetical protein